MECGKHLYVYVHGLYVSASLLPSAQWQAAMLADTFNGFRCQVIARHGTYCSIGLVILTAFRCSSVDGHSRSQMYKP